MAKNPGKKFEEEFKKSCPSRLLLIRIPDPPQSFKQSDELRFSPQNPCDYIGFDTETRTLFCLELKSTKSRYVSFEDENTRKKTSRLVKRHQIRSLTDFNEYDNVVSGFVFNFRDESETVKRTYFQSIKDFNYMVSNIDKKSFNEIDLIKNNAIKIDGRRMIKNYSWDIESFLNTIATEHSI